MRIYYFILLLFHIMNYIIIILLLFYITIIFFIAMQFLTLQYSEIQNNIIIFCTNFHFLIYQILYPASQIHKKDLFKCFFPFSKILKNSHFGQIMISQNGSILVTVVTWCTWLAVMSHWRHKNLKIHHKYIIYNE